LLPVREGAGGEKPVPMDDGGCNRGHFCPIKGPSGKRLPGAEKPFSLFRTGKRRPGPSDYKKARRKRTRCERKACAKLLPRFVAAGGEKDADASGLSANWKKTLKSEKFDL
jgi:hypothetical protein